MGGPADEAEGDRGVCGYDLHRGVYGLYVWAGGDGFDAGGEEVVGCGEMGVDGGERGGLVGDNGGGIDFRRWRTASWSGLWGTCV